MKRKRTAAAASYEACASFLERKSNYSSPWLSTGICTCAHMWTRGHTHTHAQSTQPDRCRRKRQRWEITSCSPLRLQRRYVELRVREEEKQRERCARGDGRGNMVLLFGQLVIESWMRFLIEIGFTKYSQNKTC